MKQQFDVVIVGAGFAGMYMLHRVRGLGFTVRLFETGSGVGGTWYWNRYPGARCDVESMEYSYQFSEALQQEWRWSERYAAQPEIMRYANHVADRFDLRRDMQFDTRVVAAEFREVENRWNVRTQDGAQVLARFLVMATGCLSSTNLPKFEGLDSFAGEIYHTGRWPHHAVEFTGKRVGVIGTGSSGVQSIPVIASQAGHTYVFQRTPQYTIPARHGSVDKAFLDNVKKNYDEIYEKARWSLGGMPYAPSERSALSVSDEERQAIYEAGWQEGGFKFLLNSFFDIGADRRANDTASEFIRAKIREIVKDPEVAEKLVPVDHPFTSKRPLIDTNYFDTYNRENVTLVDIRHAPIEEITPTGIRTEDGEYELDIIVFATGFDAMTGTFNRIDIQGRHGEKLKDKWAHGPLTYLGVATAGYPNFFMITGPGSPSVLSNMPVSIEQHVEWISGAIEHMREEGLDVMEADEGAEEEWVEHVNGVAEQTMFMLADSWYLGANIPGKPRVFMPYPGGVGNYRQKCNEVTEAGYEGFTLHTVDPVAH
jgi:cation diffusion facilitator CzcD-associated flavoprotein CzcO